MVFAEVNKISQTNSQLNDIISQRERFLRTIELSKNKIDLNDAERNKLESSFGQNFSLHNDKIKELLDLNIYLEQIIKTNTALLSTTVFSLTMLERNVDWVSFEHLQKSFLRLSKYSEVWRTKMVPYYSGSLLGILGTGPKMPDKEVKEPLKLEIGDLDYVFSKFSPMKIEVSKSFNIYIYPSLLIVIQDSNAYAFELNNLVFRFTHKEIKESESTLKKGAVIVANNWDHENEDGSRDLRFKYNRRFPVAKYGLIEFKQLSFKFWLTNLQEGSNWVENLRNFIEFTYGKNDDSSSSLLNKDSHDLKSEKRQTSDEELNDLAKKNFTDLKNNNLKKMPENTSLNETKPNQEELGVVLDEIDSLIGLKSVKEEIRILINHLKIQEQRKAFSLKTSNVSYHMVFTGNPGTGKTTMARLVARVFKALGILEKGHLIETDRSGLIAEYLGQTSKKVNDIVDSAIGGVLFIDEAYALVSEDGNDSYGEEAAATLIKRMEDNRKELVVIMAGYTDEMKEFIDTNPGLESRINRYIDFPDYPPDELFQIFELYCKNSQYNMTMEAKSKLRLNFIHDFELRDKSFGNGRLVRNIFEQTIENQSNRIAHYPNLDKDILMKIEESDIPMYP